MEHIIFNIILVVYIFIFYNGWMAFMHATCHLIFDHKIEKHHISDTLNWFVSQYSVRKSEITPGI